MATTCAALALVVGLGWFYQYGMAADIVGLQVNPSFELRVNRAEQVLAVQPMNEDATAFLQQRNYRGWGLDETIESLVVALAEQNYLSVDKNVVHLTVSGANEKKLEQRLSTEIRATLATKGIVPEIVPVKKPPEPTGSAPSQTPPSSSAQPAQPEQEDDDDDDDRTDDNDLRDDDDLTDDNDLRDDDDRTDDDDAADEDKEDAASRASSVEDPEAPDEDDSSASSES
ncbi:MAG: hypothetical protein RR049_02355, partial [Angelakisella sp.]